MEDNYIVDGTASIETAIQNLRRKDLMTDFCFISKDGDKISAHKLIVAIHSPILCGRIYGLDSLNQILEEVTATSLQSMLSHFYGEEIVFGSIYELRDIEKLAVKYEIFQLVEKCKNGLKSIKMDPSNVFDVLETAFQFKDEAKEAECLTLITKNKDEMLKSEPFIKKNFGDALNILNVLIERNLITEELFLKYTIQWPNRNDTINKKDVLVKKLSKLSVDQFLDIIILFPDFFSNIEISDAANKVRQKQLEKNNLAIAIVEKTWRCNLQ